MPSLTRATLVSRIRTKIGDTATTGSQLYTDAQIQDIIQDGMEQFVLDTRALKDVATTSSVAGTRAYSLPSDIMFDLRLAYNGVEIPRTSQFDLDNTYFNDWSQQTGTPTSYYVDLDPNNQKLYLFPTPSTAVTNGIVLEYVKIPPTLSGDSSVPFDAHTLMTPYHAAIVYWVSAYLVDSNMTQENLFNKREWQKEYQKLVNNCVENFKDLEFTKSNRMRGGRYFKGL